MKNCPVCNIQVEDLYTGLCPNSLCSWEFEFISSEMTPELQKRYAEKLAKCRHLYELNVTSDKKYDYISHYSENLAIVILDNKYGVIDRKGREIVPTIYEYITDYTNGWAIVTLAGGSKSWIDTKGTIIPLEEHPLCKQASSEKEKEKTQEKSDNNSREISSQKKESSSLIEKTQPQNLKRKNLWIAGILAIVIGIGFWLIKGNSEEDMTTQKKIVHIEQIHDRLGTLEYFKFDNISKGLISVMFIHQGWGVIDTIKQEIILKCDWIGQFSEGLASVKLNNKWGFIDKKGKKKISFKYDYARFFSEGLAVVELNDRRGVIDKNGQEIVSPKYWRIQDFLEGLAAVCIRLNENNKWGFIDKNGREIIPLIYDDAEVFSAGVVAVKLNNKYGLLDRKGKYIVPLGYYNYIVNFSEDLIAVTLNHKIGLIDKTGKEVIPLKYEGMWRLSEGLACVELNNKYGFIDKNGKEIIPLIYDYCDRRFRKGKVRVRIGKRYFTLDKKGKRIGNDK